MAEQSYELSKDPVYNEAIRKLQNTDFADAFTVFNPLIQAILENIHAVKLLTGQKAGSDAMDGALAQQSKALDTHAKNTTLHVTAAERSKWNGKAEASALNTHAQNTTLHVTAAERSAWNGKAAGNHSHSYLPLSGGTLTGNLRLKNSGNYGLKLNFGDSDYVYFYEPTDDFLEIKGSRGIALNGTVTNTVPTSLKTNEVKFVYS